jgi:protein O-mannosyl-transferase
LHCEYRAAECGPSFMAIRIICPAALVLAAIALTGIAFAPGLSGPFLLDDHVNLTSIRISSLNAQEMQTQFRSTDRFGGLSRSVAMASLALTEFFRGFDPKPFKQENLLIHSANGLLIFWFIRLLIAYLTPQRSATYASVVAYLAALAWLLHPLHVSTVLYVVQRLVLLSAFFSLLTLCLYLEGRVLLRRRATLGAVLISAALLFAWPLALLSKENAILVAPAIVLIEVLFRTSIPSKGKAPRASHVLLAVVAASTVGFALLQFQDSSLLYGYAGRDFNLQERLLTQANVIFLYLKLILVPIPWAMSLFHDDFPVQRLLDTQTLAAIGGILLLLALAALMRRTAALAAFGILWFFLWHLLESTVIPLELVFEHRNYLALLGPILVLLSAGSWLLDQKPRLRNVLLSAWVALLALLLFNTYSRATVWANYELMTTVEYAAHPNSPRLNELMHKINLVRGELTEARKYLRKLQTLERENAGPFLQEILLMCDGDTEIPDALLETTARLTADGLLRPITLSNVRTLAQQRARGACIQLSDAYVLHLARAMAVNERVHNRQTRVAAMANLAQTEAAFGEPAEAQAAIAEALALADSFAIGSFTEVVKVAERVATQFGSPDDAAAFLREVLSPYAEKLAHLRMEIRVVIPKGNEPQSRDEAAVLPSFGE